MGFLVLESDNPNMSYVLNKNPNTPLHIRSLRKGYCIGWYHDTNTYVIRFTDVMEKVSFRKSKFDNYDYLPYMQYCSPMLLTCVIKEMFSTLINKGSDNDVKCKCSIEQALMKISNKALKVIQKLNQYIKKYIIKLTSTNIPGLYNFILTTTHDEVTTLQDILSYAYILGYIINSLTFGRNENPQTDALDKILKIINSLNVPYYIRYVFKTYMIPNFDFDRVKLSLEGSDNIIMQSGNTQMQRYNCISKHILDYISDVRSNINSDLNSNIEIDIVDIGCGEGFYLKKLFILFNKLNIKVTYHTYDINTAEIDKIDLLVNSDSIYVDSISNVKTYRCIDEMISQLNLIINPHIMIIFSEVIEHIPLDIVENYMLKIMNSINFDRIVMTTPQKEFNINYLLNEGEFRHEDHKQEMTKIEFIIFINSIIDKVSITSKKINTNYLEIGDMVDGISMCQGMLITTDYVLD